MTHRIRTLLLLSVVAGLPWACGDASTAGPARGSAGEAAAEHGLAPDWALLSVPAGGGTATLHPLSDPGRELWSGAVALPAVRSAVRVAPRLVALRGEGGEIYRYDPGEDAVSSVAEVTGDVRWNGGEDAGVWLRSAGSGGGTVWSLSPEGATRRDVDRSLRWAAPAADGATVALLGSDPAVLVRWSGDGSEPEASHELRAGPPAVITAWGRKAVLTRTDETGVLQVVSVAGEMETTERIQVGGPVTALAASPSSHQIYVGVDDPPRLVVVDRFGGEVRTRARFERPIREIRPGVAGGPPVAWDGRAAHLVPWGGGQPVRLETEWRPDLPVSLPDGSALVVRDGSVERVLAGDGGGSSSAPADRLWVPLRWRAEAEARSGPPDTVGAKRGAAAAVVADSAGRPRRGGPAEAAARDSAGTDTAGLDPALEITDAGFYVILGWERSPEAIEARLRPIREAGFPVGVQTRRDDAGRQWLRGLVGPYARRSRAERVARTLQREHAVEGWVQEVRPGLLSDEVFR